MSRAVELITHEIIDEITDVEEIAHIWFDRMNHKERQGAIEAIGKIIERHSAQIVAEIVAEIVDDWVNNRR